MVKIWNKFKSWIIVFFIGSAVLAAGSGMYEEQKLETDLKAIPAEYRLKADKNKILNNREVDWLEKKDDGSIVNKGRIVKYDYITGREVKDKTLFIGNSKYSNVRIFQENSTSTVLDFFEISEFYKDDSGKIFEIDHDATTTIDSFNIQTKDSSVEKVSKLFAKKAIATDYYVGSADGDVYIARSSSWDTSHDATTGNGTNGWGSNYCRILVGKNSGGYYEISRCSKQVDTSAIADDATIASAVFYGYIEAKDNDDNDGDDWVNIVQTTIANPTSLAAADFDTIGAVNNPTEGSDRVDISGVSTSAYSTWTLNATGLTWISKTGYTLLGFREGHDAIDSPHSGGNSTFNYLQMTNVDYTGTSQDPFLRITIATPSTGGYQLINFE